MFSRDAVDLNQVSFGMSAGLTQSILDQTEFIPVGSGVFDPIVDGTITQRYSYFNVDLKRVFNYNEYEKYRFGLGIETSEKLMRPLLFGAYFGYGTGDKTFKYGGYSTIFLNRKTGTKLNLYIQKDVSEVGATKPFFSPGLFSTGT
jgi:hypothetical protein